MSESALVRLAKAEDVPCILELYRELAITAAPVEASQSPTLEDYQRTFDKISVVPWHELLVAEV